MAKLRLLFVEDRASDAKLVARQLEKAGLDFTWTRVFTQRELAAALEEPVDAVLADYHLPQLDVRKVLRQVKDRLPDVPFIVVSGSMNEGNGIELMKLGADDYVLKDRLERLATAIDQAQKRIAERLERQALQVRFQRLVEGLPGFVYTCDVDAPALTTYVSPQVEAMLGVSQQDYLADPESWRKALHPDDRDWVVDRFDACMAEGRQFDYEYRLVARDGSVRWVRDQAAVFFDSEGRPKYAQGVTLDITERRLAHQAMLENEAKNRFLANMSHELRNPLNSVLGFAELLTSRDTEGLNDRQRRYLGHIETAGQQLLALVNDVLDLSKVVAGRMPVHAEDFPLDGAIDDCLGQMQPQAEVRSVTLGQRGKHGLLVFADRQRLLQILINLVSNGIKFSPPGGRVTLSRTQEGEALRIDVEDNGPGIPGDKLEFIFDEFAQLEGGKAGGTGLGLTLSRRLAELMGGSLEVASKIGEGSVFTLRLPAGAPA